MSLFGSLLPSSQVEQAVLDTCNLWMETYLAEVERQQAIPVGTIARWRSAQTSYDFENWAEGQVPALVVVCPGTTGDPERRQAGVYSAWFEVNVGVLVEDATEADARRVSQFHQAAVEGLLVQHGSLGGFAEGIVWQSRQSRLPDVANRTLAYAESTLRVLVDGIADSSQGPAAPEPPPQPDQPAGDWPEVVDTPVQITGLPLT